MLRCYQYKMYDFRFNLWQCFQTAHGYALFFYFSQPAADACRTYPSDMPVSPVGKPNFAALLPLRLPFLSSLFPLPLGPCSCDVSTVFGFFSSPSPFSAFSRNLHYQVSLMHLLLGYPLPPSPCRHPMYMPPFRA